MGGIVYESRDFAFGGGVNFPEARKKCVPDSVVAFSSFCPGAADGVSDNVGGEFSAQGTFGGEVVAVELAALSGFHRDGPF